MNQIVIGISGINAMDNPGPGTGIARSLREDKELNIKLVGIAYDALEPGIYMDWLFDEVYIMPYPSSESQATLDRMKYIQDSSGINFFIPCLDAELPLYIKFQRKLKEMGITTVLPGMENFKLRGKDKLDEIAKLIGLPSPEMQVVNTVEDLNKAVEEIGFPVMIKGAFYGADKAINMQDAQKHYHSVVAQWGYPVIVQKETAGEEINLVGVGNGEGSLLGHVAVKKMSRTKQGKIWTGVSIHNDELKNAAKTFVSKYKWNGPFEMECIIHNNEMYLLEINPRFPAWVYFAAGVGVNLPSRLIRDVYGLDNKNESYESGKLYVRHTSEHITDMATFQKIITQGEIK